MDTLLVVKDLDTVFRFRGPTNGLTVRDFDSDGHDDIIIHHITNMPGIEELIRYSTHSNGFVEVQLFSSFPSSTELQGTGLFYSYHRSGCADMNWDSDLFFLDDSMAVRVGNIHGEGCEDITRTLARISYAADSGTSDDLVVMDSLVFDAGCSSGVSKWDFIREYWTANWKEFLESNR
ncbi:MAG: hypothetical protein IPJ76_12490 [Flavobacteriales bacterium]|nr:MAG: hypothetical protein IPJ76_12490 [Flavobacteriales bacterium]